MVPSSTKAPMFTKDGISTTFLAMWAPRRTIEPGTARKPASPNCSWVQSPNLEETLSHQGPTPGSYVDLGALGLGTSDFTISHWYATTFDVANAAGDVIGDRQAASHGNFVSVRVHGDGSLAFEVDQDDAGTNYSAISSGDARINDGRWHHLAYTRHGRELAIYIDGVQVARGGSPSAAPARLDDETPFRIGRSLPPFPRYQTIAGSYADVQVVPRALGAAEIAAL